MAQKSTATRIFLCIALAVITIGGCATLKHDPPAGCESSIVYKYSPWSFTMLSGAVVGCYALSTQNPAAYLQVRNAARQVEVLLQNPVVSYGQLSEVPNIYLLLTSQLSVIFRPDQIIDKCDKEILLGYLRMI